MATTWWATRRIDIESNSTAVSPERSSIQNEDEDLAVHAYETWGFVDLDRHVIDILNQWARFLYKPLMEDRVMPIQETDGVAYGAGVAAKVHRELRETNGVTPSVSRSSRCTFAATPAP